MAGATSNFGLIKPTYNEPVDVQDFNDNFDIIDQSMQSAKPLVTSVTLSKFDWNAGSQTKTVAGVTADSLVFVYPDSSSYEYWFKYGIKATAQATDSLTFTMTASPTVNLVVQVVVFTQTRSS